MTLFPPKLCPLLTTKLFYSIYKNNNKTQKIYLKQTKQTNAK